MTVDGIRKVHKLHLHPRRFENVKVCAGVNYHQPSFAEIRNFVACQISDSCSVTVVHDTPLYSPKYNAKNLLTKNTVQVANFSLANYWVARDQNPKEFVLDLGCRKERDAVEIGPKVFP